MKFRAQIFIMINEENLPPMPFDIRITDLRYKTKGIIFPRVKKIVGKKDFR